MAGQFRQHPPPDGRHNGREVKYDWRSISEEARSRPGEWLMVDDAAGQYLVTRVREGRPASLQEEGWTFESVSRANRVDDNGSRVCELWIRAIPDSDNERTNA